jgi:hypothetical protein
MWSKQRNLSRSGAILRGATFGPRPALPNSCSGRLLAQRREDQIESVELILNGELSNGPAPDKPPAAQPALSEMLAGPRDLVLSGPRFPPLLSAVGTPTRPPILVRIRLDLPPAKAVCPLKTDIKKSTKKLLRETRARKMVTAEREERRETYRACNWRL